MDKLWGRFIYYVNSSRLFAIKASFECFDTRRTLPF